MRASALHTNREGGQQEMAMGEFHPLLERAQRYRRTFVDLSPHGCHYDSKVGAWRNDISGILAVELPDRQRPRTKKQDIETGEDQKGE